jgi:molecular chaperone DnaK
LKEYGDKIPAEKKEPIEVALKDLKEAHAAKDFAKMENSLTALNSAWEAASKELYDAMNAQQQQQQGGAQQNGEQTNTSNENVQDVNYEEVKEDKK